MLTEVNRIITNMKFIFAHVCCKIKVYSLLNQVLSDVSPDPDQVLTHMTHLS